MTAKDSGRCDCDVIHHEAVNKAKGKMLADEMYTDLSSLLKHFGDANRVRILHVLCDGELCVCDLAALLGITKSAVSHQLKVLKLAKLVSSRREGQVVFYTIADEHVHAILSLALDHLSE